MGLKLMQEDVDDLAYGNSTRLQEGNITASHTPSIDAAYRKRKADSIVALSQQLLGSADSAVAVLNDLLNYDKIEMGDIPLELTIVHIWKLIESTMLEIELPYKAKNVQYELEFGEVLDVADPEAGHTKVVNANLLPRDVRERRVIGDAIRLTQVIRNLVSNALKFTPGGGKPPDSLMAARTMHIIVKQHIDLTISSPSRLVRLRNGLRFMETA